MIAVSPIIIAVSSQAVKQLSASAGEIRRLTVRGHGLGRLTVVLKQLLSNCQMIAKKKLMRGHKFAGNLISTGWQADESDDAEIPQRKKKDAKKKRG